MINNLKENDLFVAMLDNPTFGLGNFRDVGLTPDNTGLLDKQTYRNSQYVQEKFKDDNGKFNEVAFNAFYNQAASAYQVFANDKFENDILSDMKFDPYDMLRPRDSKTKSLDFNIIRVENPERRKMGISRVGAVDQREWSVSELAQKEKVYDWKNKQWKDYTPNDNALVNNIKGWFRSSLSEPLVLALWEEDGAHKDFYGRTVKHKKGDMKLNEDGNYYYETLGNREAYGKQFKSIFDSFTVDGTAINKYDFFDSDSLDKSVTGTLMKTVATLAPLFVPGVGTYYGAAMVGANLFDILPSIYKSTLGIDLETPTANLLQGLGRSFKSSKSEYSQQNAISTENFFDLVTDVALQWALQRAIFTGFNKLMRTDKLYKNALNTATLLGLERTAANKAKGIKVDPNSAVEMATVLQMSKLKPLLERRNQMAANAALGYMAMMLGLESYESAIEQGADRSQAAILAWGTVAGMYAIDKTGLGEIFFPELKGDKEILQKAVTGPANEIAKGFKNGAKAIENLPRKEGLAKLFNSAKEKSASFWEGVQNHSLSFVGKAIGEGLEEMAEEAVADLAKSTYNLANEFGWTKNKGRLDAWENALERYGMNFFGGAVGGAIFAGVDIVQNRKNSEQLNQELIYLVRNGRTNELLSELEELRKKGKLGNKNLSALNPTRSEDGKEFLYTSPTDASDNQNEAVYKMVRSYITSLDLTLHLEGLDFTDEQLLDKMIMGDQRMKSLLEFGRADGEKFGPLMANGYHGKMLQDWLNLSGDILEKDGEIKRIQQGYLKNNAGEEVKLSDADLSNLKKDANSDYSIAYNKAVQEKAELLEKRDKFLNGTYSKYYTDLMLFAIDNNVNKFFMTPTFRDWAEYTQHKKFEEFSEAELESLKPKYEAFKSNTATELLDTAYGIFKDLNAKYSLEIGLNGDIYELFNQLRKLIRNNFIDVELTNEKLASVQSGNIDDVEIAIWTSDDRNSIEPVIREDMQLAKFTADPSISEEENAANYIAVLEANKEKLANIANLVLQIQAIGFIDKKTKLLLTRALNNPSKADIIEQGTKVTVSDETRPVFFGFSEMYDGLVSILKKLNTLNAAEIKKEALEYYESLALALEEWAENISTDLYYDSEMIESEEEFIEKTKNNILKETKNWIDLAVNTISQGLNADETIVLADKIENDLNDIKENPMYDFLKQFSSGLFDRSLTIFDILEEENRRLEITGDITEYVIDPNRAKEIDLALTTIDMTEAVLNATSTQDLDSNLPYGHNAVMNDFIKRNFPKEELYGVVREDLAEEMRIDLNQIRQQLVFLKELARMNAVNHFAEHKRTGKNIVKLMTDIIRGRGAYGKLKELSYKGINLFDGIEDLDISILDTDTNSDDVFIASDKIYDKMHDNFHKMISESGDEDVDIIKSLVKDMIGVLGLDSLVGLKNTHMDSRTEALEDYDVAVWFTTLLALKRSDYNYYLNEILNSENITFAPLYSQEYAAEIMMSLIVNPRYHNALIDALGEIDKAKYLPKLYNMGYLPGVGGAGKTSVTAKIVDMMTSRIFGDYTRWKAGPSSEQAKNLTIALGSKGDEMDIDALMTAIMGEAAFNELKNDLDNNNTESKYYDITKHEGIGDYSNYVVTAKNIEYAEPTNKPLVIYLDEITHINNVYLLHLSKWAKQNGVYVMGMGDNHQNGYDGEIPIKEGSNTIPAGIGNIGSEDALVIRTPKLGISMRVTNIQKDDNAKQILSLLNNLNFRDIYNQLRAKGGSIESLKAEMANIAKGFADLLRDSVVLKYLQNNENVLNGEKLVDKVTKEEVLRLIADGTQIGYVYDDENSETYKLIQEIIKENPDAEKLIDIFTPKLVQGSERKYFIIDTDFSKYEVGTVLSDTDNFLKHFYTMMTRSKDGTLFVDRGLSKIIDKSRFLKDENPGHTPDPSSIIEDFKNNKLEILGKSLGDYTPNLMVGRSTSETTSRSEEESSEDTEDDSAEDVPFEDPTESKEESTTSSSSSTEDSTIEAPEGAVESKDTSEERPEVKPVSVADTFDPVITKLPKSSREEVPEREKTVSKEPNQEILMEDFELEIEKKETSTNTDEDEAPGTSDGKLAGIRAYGWYMRYGVREESEEGPEGTEVKKYQRHEDEDGVIRDLNNFMTKPKDEDDWVVGGAIDRYVRMLNTVRNYLLSHQKFDEQFLKIAEKNKFAGLVKFGRDSAELALNIWNSGQFKLVVRPNNEDFDRALDKKGYDGSKVEDIAFNVIYQIAVPLKNGTNQIREFTLGKLTNPETWKTWIDSNLEREAKAKKGEKLKYEKITEKVQKTQLKYAAWYKKLREQVGNSGETLYFDLNNIKFNNTTRLKAVKDSEGKRVNFDLDKFAEENPNAMRSKVYIYSGSRGKVDGIDDKIKGRAFILVTRNKDLVIDGKQVTPENMLELYIKQKNTKGAEPAIRMVVLDAKGMYIANSTDRDQIKGTGFFQINFDDLLTENKYDKDKAREMFSTIGSNTSAARAVVALWNWRSNLRKFIKILDDNKGKGVAAINELIESDYAKNNFRLVEERPAPYYGMGLYYRDRKVVSDKISITEKLARALKVLLDSIFKAIEPIVTLPSDEKLTIGQSAAKDSKYGDIIKSLQLTDPTFTNGAPKVFHILSAIFKLYNGDGVHRFSHGAFNIKTTDKKGESINIDLNPLNGLLSNAFGLLDLDISSGTFVKNTLNMILHGRLDPYHVSEDGKRLPFFYWAPFPNGIYYHAKYQYDKGTETADFYPAKNVDKHFTYNVAIEPSNFEIDIDLDALKPSSTVSPITFTMRTLLEETMKNVAEILQPLNIEEASIQKVINQVSDKIVKEGDALFESNISSLVDNINKLLERKVKEGDIIVDNDRIMKISVTRNSDGKFEITRTSLFELLGLENNPVIPVDSNGLFDSTQLKEILYSGKYNKNFYLTLLNGTTIKGSIDFGKVNISEIVTPQIIQPVVDPDTQIVGTYKLLLSPDEKTDLEGVLDVIDIIENSGQPFDAEKILQIKGVVNHFLNPKPNPVYTEEGSIESAVATAGDNSEELAAEGFEEAIDILKVFNNLAGVIEINKNKICNI